MGGSGSCVSRSKQSQLQYSNEVLHSKEQGYSAIYSKENQNKRKSVYEENINNLQQLVQIKTKQYKNNKFLGTQINGKYVWKTYQQCYDIALKLGQIIMNMNFAPLIKEYQNYELRMVSIHSKNREEWVLTDLACNLYGIAAVPLYDTLGPDTIQFVLNQTNLQTIFASGESLQILAKQTNLYQVKQIICFDEVSQSNVEIFQNLGIQILNFNQLLQQDIIEFQALPEIKPNDIYTFSYTSGTTGNPKGALITHDNFLSGLDGLKDKFIMYQTDVTLSYLPLPHVMERFMILSVIYSGASTGFYAGDTLKLKDDLALLRPTVFMSVPRLFNKMCDKIKENFQKLQGFKSNLAQKAVSTKLDNFKQDGDLDSFFYDKLIFKKVKQIFGGRVRMMITGSAPISKDVIDFLRISCGCPILEGYGQTETAGGIFVCDVVDNQSGHVGGPIKNLQFRLMDVPEMNYTSQDQDIDGNHTPRGEIHVKGPQVFAGYYKEQQLTSDTLDESGWLKTGDIGKILKNGSLQLIDRKKNIFKLSQGEYVAPEKIEMIYARTKAVSESFVYGDSLQSYLVAVVVPDQDFVQNFAKQNNLEFNYVELCKNEQLKFEVFKQMEAQAKIEKLFSFEKAKVIKLISQNFLELDIVTNTFKMKRHEAKLKLKDYIEELYKIQ